MKEDTAFPAIPAHMPPAWSTPFQRRIAPLTQKTNNSWIRLIAPDLTVVVEEVTIGQTVTEADWHTQVDKHNGKSYIRKLDIKFIKHLWNHGIFYMSQLVCNGKWISERGLRNSMDRKGVKQLGNQRASAAIIAFRKLK